MQKKGFQRAQESTTRTDSREPARYRPSPEHKTHPGPWGQLDPWSGPPIQAQWHPREPNIEACPVDLTPSHAQNWLDLALERPNCWAPNTDAPEWKGRRWPSRLFWYVEGRGFFEAQREQRNPATSNPVTYKGYPAPPNRMNAQVADAMRKEGLLTADQYLQWRRERKRSVRRSK